ncbi:hypothetical protein KI659_10110 [Litoribacter alkaliphilus]|uniref:Uncharacterized protein n=1 Tax=Litoribacter ruber TaxID=702568 RepID=A0AAP2CIN3_9BACT|nr:hypothetical protein [Litoribacter alkaliphilus]MBS9524369.1 hypothetical protein [Litoribacter alkaliphilus]
MYTLKYKTTANFFRELYVRNPLLVTFGVANGLGFLAVLAISMFDHRMLLGVNVWVKPMKFFISIAIFVMTLAWYMAYIPSPKKVRLISIGIIAVMGLEILIIAGQASMGKLSHFNVSSPFDGLLFSLMGMAIVVNTLLVLWAFVLFRKAQGLPRGYKLAIQLGMAIFILASLEGFVMVSNLGHTIGAEDGQPGWFFLNWAYQYGDLRVAHFLGLHALQAVPLFAWFVSKDKVRPVVIFALVYGLLSLATFLQALAGLPLIFMN